MRSTAELSKIIVERLNEQKNWDDIHKMDFIRTCIGYHLNDAFKLLKNINETSLPGSDRMNRITSLVEQLGHYEIQTINLL